MMLGLSLSLTGSRVLASEFDPLSLSPYLWIDAAVAASVLNASDAPASDGEAVKTIQDQSGNGRHLTQGTAANRPVLISASRLLNFDGVNDAIAVTGLTLPLPYTTVLVMMQDTWTANDTPLQCVTAGNSGKIRQAGTTPEIRTVNGNNETLSSTELTLGVLDIVTCIWSSTADQSLLRIGENAPQTGTNSAGDGNAFIIGAADTAGAFVPCDMKLAEAFVFTGALSADDQTALRAYLRAKWSTP